MEKSPLDLYTLEDACKLFFPGLPVGPDDLLAMARKKRLRLTRINRIKLVSGDAIREMIKCQESENQRASGLKSGQQEPSGSFSTAAEKSALAFLKQSMQRPKARSRRTS